MQQVVEQVAQKKICPSCKNADFTSFSTCRFCRTRYDAPINEPNYESVSGLITWIVAAACVVIFAADFCSKVRTEQSLEQKTIISQVVTSKRPRVVEFYATWCAPCHAYGPTIDKCASRYGAQVDFQRINIDVNRNLAKAFNAKRIPTTCLINRNGQIVDQFTGNVSEQELSKKIARLTGR